jgi:hypothetical protein
MGRVKAHELRDSTAEQVSEICFVKTEWALNSVGEGLVGACGCRGRGG